MSGTATLLGAAEKVDTTRGSRRDAVLVDALVALILGAVAAVVRWHVPADGLFYDDAWQAFGARKGSLSELVTVGQTQPGFTAGLMMWTRLFGMSTASLVTPAFIAGTLGPPALYLVLRRFGHARSIAFLVGAALASAQIHIIYSYHVKTYTFDVLIILGLALAVRYLARRHWLTSTAVAWFVGSIAVGSFSSMALIGTGVAGLILVLHSCGDRQLRATAVAAQAVVLSMLYLASSRTYNQAQIRRFFAARGGYIDFDPNPLTLGRNVFDHFWNVADVFPGRVPTLALVAAGVGLLVAAWRGPLSEPARFLGVMVVVAVGGGVLDIIPFGPPRAQGRVSLWLVPAMALGLCAALEIARRRISARAALRTGFDALVCIAAVVVLIGSFGSDHPYPAGARSAIRRVMAEAGPGDVVVMTNWTSYSFALYSGTPVGLRATPERSIGFLPTFGDRRLHRHDPGTTPEQFDAFVEDADRVYLVHANVMGLGMGEYLFKLDLELAFRGFTRISRRTIDTGYVEVWDRQPAKSSSVATVGGRT
jgi:hypothetical protein